MSIENKIELLWNSAKTLQSDFHAHKILKSYYINTCRIIAKNNLQVPKEKFASSHMCPYCGIFWNDSEFSLKLIPKQFHNSSKAKKLIEKLELNKGTDGKALNKNQRNRAKWLKKKMSNHLAVSCCQCKRKSLLKLEKPKYKTCKQLVSEENQTEKEAPAIDFGKISLKKKKKSKNVESNSVSTSMLSKLSKEKLGDKSQKTPKTKNKRADNKSSKVISKTQKQNSLLHLAALLQKQSKDDMKNSANRLQSFLK